MARWLDLSSPESAFRRRVIFLRGRTAGDDPETRRAACVGTVRGNMMKNHEAFETTLDLALTRCVRLYLDEVRRHFDLAGPETWPSRRKAALDPIGVHGILTKITSEQLGYPLSALRFQHIYTDSAIARSVELSTINRVSQRRPNLGTIAVNEKARTRRGDALVAGLFSTAIAQAVARSK